MRPFKTHLNLPSFQLAADVRQVVGDDVQQTCCQEDSARKTADQTQDGAVSLCKLRYKNCIMLFTQSNN